MALTATRLSSGLLVAEHSQDFATVAQAVRDYRDDLRLVPGGVDRNGKIVYQVLADRGDRPAIPVFHGRTPDLQDALPLSASRFLEELRFLDANTRGAPEDPDVANQRLRDRINDDSQAVLLEIGRDNDVRSRRSPCLPRGQSLRRARDKDRAQGRRI